MFNLTHETDALLKTKFVDNLTASNFYLNLVKQNYINLIKLRKQEIVFLNCVKQKKNEKFFNKNITNKFVNYFVLNGKKLKAATALFQGIHMFFLLLDYNEEKKATSFKNYSNLMNLFEISYNLFNLNLLLDYLATSFKFFFFFKVKKVTKLNKKQKLEEKFKTNIIFLKKNKRLISTLKFFFYMLDASLYTKFYMRSYKFFNDTLLNFDDSKLAVRRVKFYKKVFSKVK